MKGRWGLRPQTPARGVTPLDPHFVACGREG